MTRWIYNPILHFAVLGGLLFAGREAWQQWYSQAPSDRAGKIIAISASQVSELSANFHQQWGRAPTPAQLHALIQDAVDGEILYREARRLRLDIEDRSIRLRLVQKMRAVSADPGLDDDTLYQQAVQLGLDDDLVIKRMLRQKMRLLLQEAGPAAPPSEQEMRAYMERHPGRFQQAATVTFSHVFVSARVHGVLLQAEAAALLETLRSHAVSVETAASLSDPLPMALQFEAQSRYSLTRTFGADFAAQVFTLPLATWAGPLASPFGLHIVWVHSQRPAQMVALDTVQSQVKADLAQAQAMARLASGMQQLRHTYDIRIESHDTGIARELTLSGRQS